MKVLKNLIVVGCGLHFREMYHHVLENSEYSYRILLAIDLLSEKNTVETYFSGKKVVPENTLFLSETFRNSIFIDELDRLIRLKINPSVVDGIIICTEPKSHKIYSLWALQNNLSVFVDKPLTAFSSSEKMDTLYQDYVEISEALKLTTANFVISCERRAHLGYTYIKNHLSTIIQQTGLPITFIDIHFGDGRWLLPDEGTRENHPFKYGYGTLLHSGYHYIDLLMSLINLNSPIVPVSEQILEIHTLSNDFNSFFMNDFYKKNLNCSHFEREHYGEADFMAMGRFLYQGSTVTNFNLKLMKTSVSNRNIYQKLDKSERLLSKGGKLRQENVIIHIGHVCSLHLRSNPYQKLQNQTLEDFSVDIFHNTHLLKKEPLIQLNRSDFSNLFEGLSHTESMNKKARRWQLADFLQGGDGNSHLLTHKNSIHLLDTIYKQLQEAICLRRTDELTDSDLRNVPENLSANQLSGPRLT